MTMAVIVGGLEDYRIEVWLWLVKGWRGMDWVGMIGKAGGWREKVMLVLF